VYDDLWSGRLSVVNEDLVHAFEEKIRENRQFTITAVSLHCPQISWSLLHQTVSGKVKFRKLCANCAKVAYGRTQIGTAGHDIGLSDTIQ